MNAVYSIWRPMVYVCVEANMCIFLK